MCSSVVAKLSLKQLRNLYFKMCPRVFGGILKAVEHSSEMEKILKSTFGDKVMMDEQHPK